ncbi:MAG: FHA domain-containing protein [Pseudomonadales bacterium]
MIDTPDIPLWVSDGSRERALTRPLEVGGHPRSDFLVSSSGVRAQIMRLVPERRGGRVIPAAGGVVVVNGVEQRLAQGLMPGDRITVGSTTLEIFTMPSNLDSAAPWRIAGSAANDVAVLFHELRIGRDESSDIVLPDLHASRHHAALYLRAGAAWVRDLGSRNGSFVNGERLYGATRLFPGDILVLDRAVFTVLGPEGVMPALGVLPSAPDGAMRETRAMRAPDRPPATANALPTELMRDKRTHGGWLRPGFYLAESTLTGAGGWHQLVFGRTLVGRAGDCDLKFQDRSVSAHHCEFHYGPGGVFLRDLGSSNGTRVNEKRVKTTVVRDGDRITIGRVHMTLREVVPLRRARHWLQWLRRSPHAD